MELHHRLVMMELFLVLRIGMQSLKVNLLEVIWMYCYSKDSTLEHGTLYQLCNLINRSNVGKPSADFNSCDDFFVLVITCHILTAALKIIGMSSLQDTPSDTAIKDAEDIWMHEDTKRREVRAGR